MLGQTLHETASNFLKGQPFIPNKLKDHLSRRQRIQKPCACFAWTHYESVLPGEGPGLQAVVLWTVPTICCRRGSGTAETCSFLRINRLSIVLCPTHLCPAFISSLQGLQPPLAGALTPAGPSSTQQASLLLTRCCEVSTSVPCFSH